MIETMDSRTAAGCCGPPKESARLQPDRSKEKEIAFYEPYPAAGLYGRDGEAPDWAAIAADPALAEPIAELRAEAARLQERPEPQLTEELYAEFEREGRRLGYEAAYFERRGRLTAFGLLTLLGLGGDSARALMRQTIDAVLGENTWCLPAHMKGEAIERGIDLFASETGFALAELLVLGGDALDEPLRRRIAGQLERRLFGPYLEQGPYPWETAEHNWSAVCAGSIGAAALLTLPADDPRLERIVAKALGSMDAYLAGFGDDGACLEGIGYWTYGFGYYVYFADLLRARTGGRLDLLDGPKEQAIAGFQQKAYLCGSRTVNFSDAEPHERAMPGLAAYLSRRYPGLPSPPPSVLARFGDDPCARFAPALRNLLWRAPAERGAPAPESWPSGSWLLPDAGWLVSRHRSAGGSFGFAAKGGHNTEPHNHLDLGHFLLVEEGEPDFAADLGSGEYTAAYFGPERYGYACTGAHGHSLPSPLGLSQLPGRERFARILEAEAGAAEDRLRLELAAAYALPPGASLTRRLRWRKQELPELELTDELRLPELAGAARPDGVPLLATALITRCEPLGQEDGSLLLHGNRRRMRICWLPGSLRLRIERHSFSNHSGLEETYVRLAFETAAPVDAAASSASISLSLRFLP